jgi:hypothetical protein
VDIGDGRALSFGPRGILAFVALNTCHYAYLSMSRVESIRILQVHDFCQPKENNNNPLN